MKLRYCTSCGQYKPEDTGKWVFTANGKRRFKCVHCSAKEKKSEH